MRLTRAAALVFALSVVSCTATSPAVDPHERVDTGPQPSPVAALMAVPVPNPPRVTGRYPTHCIVHPPLPDPACTPGSVNPAVTEDNVAGTVCAPGWAVTVRPPGWDTARVKTAAMVAYGEPAATRATTELDHLIPLELGGSDDTSNLWPEPSDLPGQGFRNSKDTVEAALNTAVCHHRITLAAARRAIAADWTTARQKLGV
jgi:hypothetical protein